MECHQLVPIKDVTFLYAISELTVDSENADDYPHMNLFIMVRKFLHICFPDIRNTRMNQICIL